MKRPRPKLPENAPEGTVWFGGPIRWFSISLIVRSADLVPDEVTRQLLVTPTRTRTKGVPLSQRGGAPVSGFGSWAVQLTSQETDEWDVSEAVRLLLSRFPEDLEVWKQLSASAKICLSVGLHLETTNQGFSLPSDVLRFAADRDIDIDFDIYDR